VPHGAVNVTLDLFRRRVLLSSKRLEVGELKTINAQKLRPNLVPNLMANKTALVICLVHHREK